MIFEDTRGLLAIEGLPAVDSCEGIDSGDACSAWASEETIEAGRECIKSSKPNKPQRTGRKPTEGSQQLSGILTSKNRPLKVEYKRCQIIRFIKKMTRELSSLKFSKKFLNEYGVTSEENVHLLLRLQQIYLDNKELFDSLKGTDSGPATDGKSKGKREATTQPKARSFNREYCQQFYMHECVREFHDVLVDLIYGRIDEVEPSALCRKFNEFCCIESQHTKKCVDKWTNVLNYMKRTLIKDLDLEPVSDVSDYIKFHPSQEISETTEIIVQETTQAETLQLVEISDTTFENFEEFDETEFFAYKKEPK